MGAAKSGIRAKKTNRKPNNKLANAASNRGSSAPTKAAWTRVQPAPEEAFPVEVKLNGQEPHRAKVKFDNMTGKPLFAECWFVTDDGTRKLYASWCQHRDGHAEWQLEKTMPTPPSHVAVPMKRKSRRL